MADEKDLKQSHIILPPEVFGPIVALRRRIDYTRRQTSRTIITLFLNEIKSFEWENAQEARVVSRYRELLKSGQYHNLDERDTQTIYDMLLLVGTHMGVGTLLTSAMSDVKDAFLSLSENDNVFDFFELSKDLAARRAVLRKIIKEGKDFSFEPHAEIFPDEQLWIIAENILNVSENEVFVDCCADFGTTFLMHKTKKTIGYVQFPNVAAILSMIVYLCEDTNVEIRGIDFNYSTENYVADKLLLKVPNFAQPINESPSKVAKEYIIKAFNMLKEHGKAMIVLPAVLLTRKDFAETREKIVENNLSSVIIFSPYTFGTRLAYAVLCIDKTYHHQSIMMIDASREEFPKSIETEYDLGKTKILLSKLNKAILNHDEIEDFSKEVSKIQLFNSEISDFISLNPRSYVVRKNKDFRPTEEIAEELNEYYKKLAILCKETKFPMSGKYFTFDKSANIKGVYSEERAAYIAAPQVDDKK